MLNTQLFGKKLINDSFLYLKAVTDKDLSFAVLDEHIDMGFAPWEKHTWEGQEHFPRSHTGGGQSRGCEKTGNYTC